MWVADYIVSQLRQDSRGFPIIFPEMMISNSASFPATTRWLKGGQETAAQEEMLL